MSSSPRNIHSSTSRQPRDATGNGLSDGAIAGIVIGSIFGLLILLVPIVWICLLGSRIFTRAKQLSTSVVDKAEKGHARAKDLYTAGREQGLQAPDLQDAAHYDDSKSELRHDSVEHHPLGSSFMIAQQNYETCTPTRQTSTEDVKPVVVDAKRILGTDDASYLNEITSHGRKCSKHLAELRKVRLT